MDDEEAPVIGVATDSAADLPAGVSDDTEPVPGTGELVPGTEVPGTGFSDLRAPRRSTRSVETEPGSGGWARTTDLRVMSPTL